VRRPVTAWEPGVPDRPSPRDIRFELRLSLSHTGSCLTIVIPSDQPAEEAAGG